MKIDNNVIYIAFYIVLIVAFIKEILIPLIKKKKTRKETGLKIQKRMNEENLSFEQAKNRQIIDYIAELGEVKIDIFEFNNLKIKKYDRVSFKADEIGYINGYFVGLKASQAKGYTYHFVIKTDNDKIISAPVELIYEDTVVVYGS